MALRHDARVEERMQTLLYVWPLERGDELAVRAAHEAFPAAALERGAGIVRLVAFIGSGMYAMEITTADGDVQERLRQFLAAPAVQQLFDALRPYVRDLPSPGEHTADMPLATAMLLWQADDAGPSHSV
ncbi:MAG: hypothetical protein IT337_16350 [Thermomicrobiales bacterium]|nr:hypothetical protein [Thermomicrobiales bacterium]